MTAIKSRKGRAGISVIELPEERLSEAVGIMTRTFLANPNFVYLFRDEGTRARALPYVQRACLRDAPAVGRVHLAIREGEIAGVAAWLPPGGFPLSPRRQLRAAPDMARVLASVPRSLPRPLRFTAGVTKLHPARPYWYLEVVGVDPSEQGSGTGTRLLQPGVVEAEGAGQPCYLQTMTERNVGWYRRLGFEVREAGVSFVPGGPPNWTMIRRPEGS